jgi:hypothetical protein
VPHFIAKKNVPLSMSVDFVLLFRANWLESDAGGHHLPYMPSDITHGLAE